jgi:RHS repeat-associated protein
VMIERFEYRDTTNADGTPNQQLATDLAANLVGQLVRHYDPSGLTVTVRRDFKGNVLQVKRKLNNQPKEALIDWNSDPDNFLKSETFTQITEFDALNRMTRHYNWHVESPDNSGNSERVAVYVPVYNQRGALAEETLLVRAHKIPDGHEEVAGITQSQPAIKRITYNAKGQKIKLELGNGTTTRYTYDRYTFRLAHLFTRRDSRFLSDCDSGTADDERPLRPCGVQNLHYTYDPVGNITHIQDDAQPTIYFQNARVDPSNDYVYDALYRLISASGREDAQLNAPTAEMDGPPVTVQFPITGQTLRNYTQHYRYDSVGNIEQMEHVANTNGQGRWTRYYEYAADSNRLLRTWHGDADWNSNNAKDKTSYVFDTHGNMLNLAPVGPDQYLRWDYRDMIANINLIGGGSAYYNYDSSKQRTRKRIDKQNNSNGYWERIYLPGYELYRRYIGVNSTTPVEEIDSHHVFENEQRVLLVDDVVKTDRTHADGTRFKTGPIFRYQYGNHLGSTCLELDDQAEIISYEEYHPYGTSAYRAMKSEIEAPPQRYRFIGMERDEETGLNYHTARYYLPWLARWASTDPSGLADGVNRFVYCHSNPAVNLDKNGSATTNYDFGKTVEAIFQQVVETIAENRKSEGRGSTVTMGTQKGYNKGNSFLDFEFRSFVDNEFLHSVDTKGMHLSNYMDAKGKVDYAKITAKFEENMTQAIKHITDATKGNTLKEGKTASETLLYVLTTTTAQRKQFPKQIADVENFLKAQGAAALEGAGPRVGVGVVRFEDLYASVKKSGKKPGKLGKSGSAKAVVVVAALLVSTYVQAEEASVEARKAPAPDAGTPPNSPTAVPGELIARKAVLDQILQSGPVENQVMNQGSKKNEAEAFNLFKVLENLFSTADDSLVGNPGATGTTAVPKSTTQSPEPPTKAQIEQKFGPQSPLGGEYSGKY